MIESLFARRAAFSDLKNIVALLLDDELGQNREELEVDLDPRYINAFKKIDMDPNQFLMVIIYQDEIIGTCHLTLMPSLTFKGSTRLQIEAVRIVQKFRAKGVGEWMINEAIEYGRVNKATIIQLASNKQRIQAINFYKKLGFVTSHEGMKLNL